MQFEEFDKKVIEAAERHHPAYDEKAWRKMEKLLDRHLPLQREGKRRGLFILLFLFLLGGGGALLVLNNQKKDKANAGVNVAGTPTKTVQPDNSGQNNSAPAQETAGMQQGSEITAETKDENKKNNIGNITVPARNEKNPDNNSLKENSAGRFNATFNNAKTNRRWSDKRAGNKPEQAADKTALNAANQKPEGDDAVILSTKDISGDKPEMKKDDVVKNEKQSSELNRTTENENKTQPVVADKQEQKPETLNKPGDSKPGVANKKIKPKSSASSHFFFNASLAPDVSFTGGDKLGTMKLLGGAGFGYTFKDRLTVRAGFYTGRKVYTASPSSYHPADYYWWIYYPNMQKIEADCKVYEIPVSLSYNFGASKSHNWFASAGVSSLLMKKEVYNYYYKPVATGPVVSRKWTITDENKHLFSVLTLSGGYQKNLSKTVSLSVEPYVKLPLSGVGFGNVKLNSTGILLSVGIKPFGANKNNNPLK